MQADFGVVRSWFKAFAKSKCETLNPNLELTWSLWFKGVEASGLRGVRNYIGMSGFASLVAGACFKVYL